MNKFDIQKILVQHPNFKDKLFCRGFLLTDNEIEEKSYPFYGAWQKQIFGEYTLLVSPKQQYHYYETENKTLILIGHSYDPIRMIVDESKILKSLAEQTEKDGFQKFFNQLTGIFTLICITDESVFLVGDATGMQTTFYGLIQNHFVVSSHTNIIGDLYDLEWDSYVKTLVGYRFFKLLGNTLPGDLTQFQNVKRLVPNHYVQFKDQNIEIKRFYTPKYRRLHQDQIAQQVGELLHNNLALIAKKWQKPAISMTGGCDSKTTLACANGLYDQFSYFSYISSDAEKVDADAARTICNALGLEHTTYNISSDDADYPNTEAMKDILYWNCGGVRPSNSNDVRKRLHFLDTSDFDVEVKSWASEIGRAYYSKRFNCRNDFGSEPTPRKCTTLYKFFFNNRRLVKQTDQIFKDYLEKYFQQSKEDPIEWQDQFFWEFRVPSWNGLVITGEHRTSFDITIPYNNRLLLELLLSVPFQDRIEDNLYKVVREAMNPAIDQTGIAVTNLKHTKNREKAENIYYMLHSKCPF